MMSLCFILQSLTNQTKHVWGHRAFLPLHLLDFIIHAFFAKPPVTYQEAIQVGEDI